MASGLTTKTATILVLLLTVSTALSACGRVGDPVKPSEAAIERAKEAGEIPPERPVPNRSNNDKRFVLDGLLE